MRNLLSQIQQDKLLHFIANAMITWVFFIVLFLFFNPIISLISAFFISLIIAALKEYIWDFKMKKGVANFKDFLFGLFGSLFESISILIILILI